MHKNDRRNKDEHHLYEIHDRERNGLFKYGISGQPLNKNGTSPRANEQVNLFNRVVGWARFFAKIILTEIAGRAKAEAIENEYINEFERKNGRKPPGNQ
ncbi:MAG: hypothetical protein MRY78_20870 [Saprospiraceae bacterium]|nr:hypothetical protein [Saprospiraceae bacterium]